MDSLNSKKFALFETNNIGPPNFSFNLSDIFINFKEGIINFDFFQKYFDQVSLPIELAKECLSNAFQQKNDFNNLDKFGKFIKLSTLKKFNQLPTYNEVKEELIDFRDIMGFTLQGELSWWMPNDNLCDGRFVFVSHRWQTPTHPDPGGTKAKVIIERLESASKYAEEIYLWIDFCCMPQRTDKYEWSSDDVKNFYNGLMSLSNIVKSCDLMILYSEDYPNRVWCYTEIFVWLCKLVDIDSTCYDEKSKLFRSIQTQHLVKKKGVRQSSTHPATVFTNLNYRGFEGKEEIFLSFFNPIKYYVDAMKSAAQYYLTSGALREFDTEYLPSLVAFLCKTWFLLQNMSTSNPSDREVCLRVIMNALKFEYTNNSRTYNW